MHWNSKYCLNSVKSKGKGKGKVIYIIYYYTNNIMITKYI
jgi:hypothetical protein